MIRISFLPSVCHVMKGLLNLSMDRNRNPEMGKAWGGCVRRMGPGRKWFCRRMRKVCDDCSLGRRCPQGVWKRHGPDPGSTQRTGIRRNPLRKHGVSCHQEVPLC